MKLTSLLDKPHVLARLQSDTLDAALGEMLARLEQTGALRTGAGQTADRAELLCELMDREARGSTALGNGVGYPHIRRQGFRDFLVAIATAPDGIDYKAPDGRPVHLVLLAIAPPEKNSLLLGVMACLSHIMADADLRERVVNASDDNEVWEHLDAADLDVTESITASHIMKAQFNSAPPDMTLADVAALMHQEHVDVLPVVDAEGRLRGEVSASLLFASCMPRYFAELPSMGFARDFDAFEHFFREKAHLKLAAVLNKDIRAIGADAPLAEIIAELARPEVSKLYVVADGKLLGVIDNFSIIDKVLSI